MSRRVYHRLVIRATDPTKEIWLGDDKGFLVQKETGTLDTDLLPGDYTVEFGLGTTTYPIKLDRNRHLTQPGIVAGPSISRPIPNLDEVQD
jgi:hypothetical protein